MKLFQRISSNIIFFIQALLAFLLFFQNKIILPPWLQTVGRMHPLMLHFPIGLLAMSFLLWVIKKNIEEHSFKTIFIFSLQLTALAASLTALMGFFLSREEGYDSSTLLVHKTAGVLLSFMCSALLLLFQYFSEKKILFTFSITASVILLIVAGDFGATLTHGKGYVWQPLKKEEDTKEEKITDSSSLFTAAIRPILKLRCFTCHNERKAKGGLIMTPEEKIIAGGKNGPIWIAGDALKSHIIQNINLPEEEKKHMPPKGKPQLSETEIQLLYTWIQSGADLKKKLKEYPDTDSLKILATRFIQLPIKEEKERVYTFKEASRKTIQQLNGPFCSVFPLSQNSAALQANFFVREKFDRKTLEDLLKIKEQLVALDLGNMPVTDADVKTISKFSNLEKLNLNNTSITNNALNDLAQIKNLRSLSLAGTKIDKNAAPFISKLDSLKEIFIWNTKISASDALQLQQKYKKIIFNTGYIPDEKEILALTPPELKNESFVLAAYEKVELKHHIPGVVLRYTTGGTVPDSTSSTIYTSPFSLSGFTLLKARATKPGWYSSPVVEYSFFQKGIQPQKAELINQTNERHRGNGAATLIDGKKGTSENTNDEAWLGFREQPFSALFYFDQPPTVNSISISYDINVPAYLMPPVEVEVWGGNDKAKMKMLKKINPTLLTKEEMNAVRIEGLKIDIPGSNYKCYKVMAKNILKLPTWHPGKGEKGWVFIDEVFFN